MTIKIAILAFCLLLTVPGWTQSDPCENYQDSPTAPHKGPRKFNVINLGYASADIAVLIADPQGHRLGVDAKGNNFFGEITRGFYEDDNTAEMDTNLPKGSRPREMTIHYASSGRYLITVTHKHAGKHWLKIRTSTCGSHWSKEVTLPSAGKGAVSHLTFIYDSHARAEPQLLPDQRSAAEKLGSF
jgi:hypothetical protein